MGIAVTKSQNIMSEGPRKPEDQLRQFADSFSDVVSSFGKKVGGFVEDIFRQEDGADVHVPMDAYYTRTDFVLEVELPGVTKKEVSLQVVDQVLSLKGSKKIAAGADTFEYLGRERRYGNFIRSVELPDDINLEQIKAKYEEGILQITFARLSPVRGEDSKEVTIE